MPDFITAEWLCILLGPVVAAGVSAFKGLALVQKYPKIVAALLSAAIAAASGVVLGSLDMGVLLECTLVQFASAVASFEVAKTVGIAGGD